MLGIVYVQLKTDGAAKHPVKGLASFEKKKKNGIWVCVGDKQGRLQCLFLLYCVTFISNLNFNLFQFQWVFCVEDVLIRLLVVRSCWL